MRGFVALVFEVYSWLIIGRILSSLFGVHPNQNQLVKFLYQVTDPVIKPLQRVIPTVPLGSVYIDLSPIMALLILRFLERLIFRLMGVI